MVVEGAVGAAPTAAEQRPHVASRFNESRSRRTRSAEALFVRPRTREPYRTNYTDIVSQLGTFRGRFRACGAATTVGSHNPGVLVKDLPGIPDSDLGITVVLDLALPRPVVDPTRHHPTHGRAIVRSHAEQQRNRIVRPYTAHRLSPCRQQIRPAPTRVRATTRRLRFLRIVVRQSDAHDIP